MNNNNKRNGLQKAGFIMEKFWLVVAIASLLTVLYIYFVEGISRENIQYLVFPALAGLMYGFRVTFRKRFEKQQDQ